MQYIEYKDINIYVCYYIYEHIIQKILVLEIFSFHRAHMGQGIS